MKREKKEEEAKMIVDLGLGLAVLARQSNWIHAATGYTLNNNNKNSNNKKRLCASMILNASVYVLCLCPST